MKFTQNQIESLLEVVRMHHILFGIEVSGTSILSDSDTAVLAKFGIDPNTIDIDMPLVDKSYNFGRLAAALGNYQAKKVKYEDFIKFVRNGGHRPLTPYELGAVEAVRSRSFNAIKNIGRVIESDLTQIIAKTELGRQEQYKDVLRGVIEEGIVNKKSVQDMVLDLGHKTQDWDRNLGRVIDTESHNAYEVGRANEIAHVGGDDSLVFKDVYDMACKHCISAYLTGGMGSAPKVFKLSELIANGTNYGRKPDSWLPTVEGMHPHCRCTMQKYVSGYVWNKDKMIFEAPSGYTKRYAYNVKITVGDETYNI